VSANGSDVIRVALPKTIFDRPGGIGLDELEEVLERQEFVHKVSLPEFGSVMNSVLQSGREEAENKNAELLECKITRSSMCLFLHHINIPRTKSDFLCRSSYLDPEPKCICTDKLS
jgi:hypothetical protein